MWAPELDAFSVASWGVAIFAAAGGSLHCVSMCGPLKILAGGGRFSRWQYQGGRLLSYLLLGACAGFLGASVPTWFLVALVALALLLSLPGIPRSAAWERARSRWLAAASAHPFLLGCSSGLLPCGLLHLWVAAAGASASLAQGSILLAILWIGTLPALELSAGILQPVLGPLRRRFPRALPLALILLALVPVLARTRHIQAKSAERPEAPAYSCPHH